MFHAIIVWLYAIVLTWCASLLAFPLVPIAVAFAAREDLDVDGLTMQAWRLPRLARWLETHDEHDGLLPGGLYEPTIRAAYDRHGWRWAAIQWLWRNRAYRFASRYQFRVDADTALMDTRGRLDVGANGPGLLIVRLNDAGRQAFEFYYVRRLYGQRGIRLRLGWKLQPLARNTRDDWPAGDAAWSHSSWAMPVLFLSPFSKVADQGSP
jgi:hypothetical protein